MTHKEIETNTLSKILYFQNEPPEPYRIHCHVTKTIPVNSNQAIKMISFELIAMFPKPYSKTKDK
jgi:hypothetical protein